MRVRGHADDRLVQVHATGRAVELRVAEGEDPAVGRGEPVARAFAGGAAARAAPRCGRALSRHCGHAGAIRGAFGSGNESTRPDPCFGWPSPCGSQLCTMSRQPYARAEVGDRGRVLHRRGSPRSAGTGARRRCPRRKIELTGLPDGDVVHAVAVEVDEDRRRENLGVVVLGRARKHVPERPTVPGEGPDAPVGARRARGRRRRRACGRRSRRRSPASRRSGR